jgi:hypothetical protein
MKSDQASEYVKEIWEGNGERVAVWLGSLRLVDGWVRIDGQGWLGG